MKALFRILAVLSVCGLLGCSTKKAIDVDSYSGRLKDFPYPHSRYAAQIPIELRDGTASAIDAIAWAKGLIDENWSSGRPYSWPLTPVASFPDLNMDGLSEILVEIPWSSGATGNRAAAFFLASKNGYRYVGIIARVASHVCYPEAQTCYLMTFGNSGQDLGIGLIQIRPESLDSIAGCRTNKFDHDTNDAILTFPEDHGDLLSNFGLGPEGDAAALPGCAAAQ